MKSSLFIVPRLAHVVGAQHSIYYRLAKELLRDLVQLLRDSIELSQVRGAYRIVHGITFNPAQRLSGKHVIYPERVVLQISGYYLVSSGFSRLPGKFRVQNLFGTVNPYYVPVLPG